MAESYAATNEDIEKLEAKYDKYISGTLEPKYAELSQTRKTLDTVRERAEVLDGVRQRNAIGKAAVRFEDLRALYRFPSRPPNYKVLGAPPTAADYNALAADVKRLYEVIGALSSLISSRL